MAAGGGGLAVAAVVLAAGQSLRAGDINKLLAPIGGTAMIARVVDAAMGSSVRDVIVVTGHQADDIRAALSGREVAFVHNARFADGMGGSIARGVAALAPDIEGVVIVLGDMPALASEDIDRLIAGFDPAGGASICVPMAGERRGNPVLFGRAHFAELKGLTGDRGARGVIADHADEVREVAIEGEGALLDLDTQEAIESFNRRREP